jgi:hypothetical protein
MGSQDRQLMSDSSVNQYDREFQKLIQAGSLASA